MKKCLTLLLVLVLVFSFALGAAAAPKASVKDGNASITINKIFISGTGYEDRPIYSVEFTVKIKKPALIGELPFPVYVVVAAIGDQIIAGLAFVQQIGKVFQQQFSGGFGKHIFPPWAKCVR